MKHTQRGFAGIVLVIILAVVLTAGGTYYVATKQKTNIQTDTFSTSTAEQNKSQNETQNDKANPSATSTTGKSQTLSFDSSSKVNVPEIKKELTGTQIALALGNKLSAKNKIEKVYRGDLNNDGYSDALVVLSLYSSEGEPGRGFEIVIQKKEGSVELVSNLMIPDSISGWSGGASTNFDSVKIENSIAYITSSSFYNSGNWKIAQKLPTQTKKFQLVSNSFTEIENSIYENIATSVGTETKKFRLYRKHDTYVYLVGTEYEGVYYKSTEVEKFKNYKELDYLQITAGAFTSLPVPEKQDVGIKNYSVDITKQIKNISDIKMIAESEFILK